MKSFNEVVTKWAAHCVANPGEIITTSGDYLVLYDMKKHKIVDKKQFKELNLNTEGNRNGDV